MCSESIYVMYILSKSVSPIFVCWWLRALFRGSQTMIMIIIIIIGAQTVFMSSDEYLAKAIRDEQNWFFSVQNRCTRMRRTGRQMEVSSNIYRVADGLGWLFQQQPWPNVDSKYIWDMWKSIPSNYRIAFCITQDV